jgi:hypothetical protein
MEARIEAVYRPSEEIVAREIEGELIIIPLSAGIGDLDDQLFSFNESGREIWRRLDGIRSLREVSVDLAAAFDAPPGKIEVDVLGLAAELLRRRILVEVERGPSQSS